MSHYSDLVRQYNAELKPGNPPEWHAYWIRRFAPFHLDEIDDPPASAIEATASG